MGDKTGCLYSPPSLSSLSLWSFPSPSGAIPTNLAKRLAISMPSLHSSNSLPNSGLRVRSGLFRGRSYCCCQILSYLGWGFANSGADGTTRISSRRIMWVQPRSLQGKSSGNEVDVWRISSHISVVVFVVISHPLAAFAQNVLNQIRSREVQATLLAREVVPHVTNHHNSKQAR